MAGVALGQTRVSRAFRAMSDMRLSRHVGAMALIAAIGLAVHAWFAAGANALDSDRALVLLMARDFARGEWSLYFWQQNYMGALEPLLLAPLGAFGGGAATPLDAALVGIALTAALAAMSVALARRLGGAPWMAALLWAVPPAVVVHHHVALYGARLAATAISVAAFTLALKADAGRRWVAIGALTGTAYFADHLMLPWCGAVFYVATRRGGIRALALGAVPIVAVDTVAAAMTPAFHLSGPNDPAGWWTNVPLLIGSTLPQLFGFLLGRAPGPLFEPAAAIVPHGVAWILAAVVGGATLVAIGVTLARRGWGKDAIAEHALVLACVLSAGLFVFTGGGGDRWPVRYLVPLWPIVAIYAALAVKQWRPSRQILGAAFVAPAIFTLFADKSWPRGGDWRPAVREVVAVAAAVESSGAKAVWADYWDTYRFALLTGDSRPWLTLRIIERRPELVKTAQAMAPVAYLLRTGDVEATVGVLGADGRGEVKLLETRDVGRYRLFVVDRPVQGLTFMNAAPTRGWQMLAALGAGALFVGTLIAALCIARFRAAERR
jgi:hypothetical protein